MYMGKLWASKDKRHCLEAFEWVMRTHLCVCESGSLKALLLRARKLQLGGAWLWSQHLKKGSRTVSSRTAYATYWSPFEKKTKHQTNATHIKPSSRQSKNSTPDILISGELAISGRARVWVLLFRELGVLLRQPRLGSSLVSTWSGVQHRVSHFSCPGSSHEQKSFSS